jgi:cytidylate kinase
MNVETLQSLIESITKTLVKGNEETYALLGKLDVPDSIKKNELISQLASAQVELAHIREALQTELNKKKHKRFWQFWK